MEFWMSKLSPQTSAGGVGDLCGAARASISLGGGRASAKQPERTTCAPTARACRGKLACPALDVARGNSYATVDASATRREEMKSHVQIELCGDTGCTCARRTRPRESKFGRRHRGNARDRGHRPLERGARGGGELAQA